MYLPFGKYIACEIVFIEMPTDTSQMISPNGLHDTFTAVIVYLFTGLLNRIVQGEDYLAGQ